MLKFSFFSPREKGRTHRSKSLDHLNASRSNEWKKEGRLSKLRRSLSFSERIGSGKHKHKGNEEKTVTSRRNGKLKPGSVFYVNGDKLTEIKAKPVDTNFTENYETRLSYSCCDLNNGVLYRSQSTAIQNRNRRETCHFPIGTSPDLAQCLCEDDMPPIWEKHGEEGEAGRKDRPEILENVPKQLENQAQTKSVVSFERTENRITSSDDYKINNCNRRDKSSDSMQVKSDKMGASQTIVQKREKRNSGVTDSREKLMAKRQSYPCRESQVHFESVLGPIKESPTLLYRSSSCASIISGDKEISIETHESPVNKLVCEQGAQQKRYVIVRRHYVNKPSSTDISCAKLDSAEKSQISADAKTSAKLLRAKSESSILSRINNVTGHEISQQVSHQHRSVVEPQRRRSDIIGHCKGFGENQSYSVKSEGSSHQRSLINVSMGAKETSIDDILSAVHTNGFSMPLREQLVAGAATTNNGQDEIENAVDGGFNCEVEDGIEALKVGRSKSLNEVSLPLKSGAEGCQTSVKIETGRSISLDNNRCICHDGENCQLREDIERQLRISEQCRISQEQKNNEDKMSNYKHFHSHGQCSKDVSGVSDKQYTKQHETREKQYTKQHEKPPQRKQTLKSIKREKKKKKGERRSLLVSNARHRSTSRIVEDTAPLLHIAAKEGDSKLLKTLLSIGVDVNEEDEEGWPALHYAIQNGHFEAAGVLINGGGCLPGYTDKIIHEYCTTVRSLMVQVSNTKCKQN